jgi:hypothetical protein
LSHRVLLLDVDAVRRIEELWDEKKTEKGKEKAG